MLGKEGYVKWFSELSKKDIAIAGVKGANLAEMYNNRFPVPPGFVLTSKACWDFISKAGIEEEISDILKGFEVENEQDLNEASIKIRKLIESASFPKDMESDILEAYEVLDVDKKRLGRASGGALDILRTSHEPPFVSVRSSAGNEDLEKASFAGQQDSFLNVKGSDELLKKVKESFSSVFSPRAIYYRHKKGLKYEKARSAVIIQKMIDAHKSGVLFSKNPLRNDGSLLVEAAWGLGPGVTSSKVNPDMYVLNSELELMDGKVRNKHLAIVRNSSGRMEEVPLKEERGKQQVLTGHEIKKLAQIALRLEEHFKKPQDIEFAIDEEEVYILQSRSITSDFFVGDGEMEGNTLFSGDSVSRGNSFGAVKFVRSPEDIVRVRAGDVLVAKSISPEMVIAMQRASGIIANIGGKSSQAAILAREIGVPFIVSDENLEEKLREGQIVSIDGTTGRIIEGQGLEKKYQINPVVPTNTRIKICLDLPDYAERAAKSGARDVGLVRLESVIAISGKHPVWYLKNDKTSELSEFLRGNLSKMISHFDNLWFRLSDVRADEYQNLEGAERNSEVNPLLGNRGIRFSLRNVALLEAELSAVKDLADQYSNKRFGIMLPHVSSLNEIDEAKKVIEGVGMPSNVRLGVMIETPASVQMINEICERDVDFVNIESDALIQHTLAFDKNHPELKGIYDVTNPGVLNSIRHVLKRARRYGVESCISGEAVSNPEIVKLALQEKVGSFSVSADLAEELSRVVSAFEKRGLGVRVPRRNDFGNVDEEEVIKGDGALGVAVSSLLASQVQTNRQIIPEGNIMQNSQKNSSGSDESEEELILKALDEGVFEEENSYSPGFGKDSRSEIPELNEAIPVDSEQFEEENNEDSFDLDSEATREAISSIRGESREIEAGEKEPEEETDEDKVKEGSAEDQELDNSGEDDMDSMLGDDEVEEVENSEDEVLDIF